MIILLWYLVNFLQVPLEELEHRARPARLESEVCTVTFAASRPI